MKIDVSTGHTKAPSGTLLVPLLLGDEKGERIFFLLHSEGKTASASDLQDECVSVLTHSVLEGEGDAYGRLESALKELNGLLKGFQLSDAVRDAHALIGLLESDGNFHLSHVGRAEAYLIRDGAATQITEYSRGKQPVAFLHIVSGPLEQGDHVVLSTQRLLRTITPAQLAQIAVRDKDAVSEIVTSLESEKEVACVAHMTVGTASMSAAKTLSTKHLSRTASLRTRARSQSFASGALGRIVSGLKAPAFHHVSALSARLSRHVTGAKGRGRGIISSFLSDLSDPDRKRRAHLFLLAGAAGLFVVIWLIVQLSLSSQKNQTRGELQSLIEQISADIVTADNRKLAGDTESANAILKRAEDRARQVMSNESGLFRTNALDLLDRIRSKREAMNNIVRIPPRIMANISSKKADIAAQGMIGISDGEFIVYDHQDLYRVLLNSVDGPTHLNTEELIVDGASFPRFQSMVFLTTGNSLIESVNGQTTVMKTEDPKGWVTGSDVKTYLRYLYILSPEKKQVYKYEHLSGRYGPATEYNVNGNLEGAIDMTITGPVYVLKESPLSATTSSKSDRAGREVVKLLRGESQNFTIRNLPPGALDGVTKIFKSSAAGNFYFLDPANKRVIITTNDGDLGESLYVKQYVLDSDQIGSLKDIYADTDDTRLYVLDEKHLYVIDLQSH